MEHDPYKRLSIRLHRYDGGLHIHPAPPYLLNYLQFYKRGMAIEGWKKKMKFELQLLYQTDGKGGVFTMPGFFAKVKELVLDQGDSFEVIDDRTAMPDPDWVGVKAIGLRDYQVGPFAEAIQSASTENGLFKAVGGWGKTAAMAAICAAWPEKHTIVGIPLKEVVTQTAKSFRKWFPNRHIGIMGAGYHDLSEDITICTYASLKLCALEKCNLLLMDEVQSVTGDKIQEVIGSFSPRKVLGFTATDENLFNGADKLLTGFFGPRLVDLGYDDSIDVNAVVPCKCYFIRVPKTLEDYGKDFDVKFRRGIKLNEVRNKMVGEVLARVPADWQSITFVDHVKDHLLEVYKHMPAGSKYIHRESSKKNIGQFALSPKQQDTIANDFRDGKFQHLLGTDAFRAGVSINNCRLVMQVAGGCSEVELLQEAYRGRRILPDQEREALNVSHKTHFVVGDFWDEGDEALLAMSAKRMKIYQSQGWVCEIIDSPDELDFLTPP